MIELELGEICGYMVLLRDWMVDIVEGDDVYVPTGASLHLAKIDKLIDSLELAIKELPGPETAPEQSSPPPDSAAIKRIVELEAALAASDERIRQLCGGSSTGNYP